MNGSLDIKIKQIVIIDAVCIGMVIIQICKENDLWQGRDANFTIMGSIRVQYRDRHDLYIQTSTFIDTFQSPAITIIKKNSFISVGASVSPFTDMV